MASPYFFVPDLHGNSVVLDEDTSKHVVGVLRKTRGAELLLTNGLGARARAIITDDNRKRCAVDIVAMETLPPVQPAVAVGISLVKNSARFEWFLEKATEIGVSDIIPLLCTRTEKEKFRAERLNGILVSALLQSQQTWLPRLHEPVAFDDLLKQKESWPLRYIAHCTEDRKTALTEALQGGDATSPRIILIGPEGDFTPVEIQSALSEGFVPVALGATRLRTETAGLTAAVLLRHVQ